MNLPYLFRYLFIQLIPVFGLQWIIIIMSNAFAVINYLSRVLLYGVLLYGVLCCNSPLQKRERTGASFLDWLDWKSKHFNWIVTEWKATQPSLRVFSGKLFKWEPHKSCKILHKFWKFCGLFTQSIQTLYFRWYLKS